MGEVLKFVTLDGDLRKKTQKNFCAYLAIGDRLFAICQAANTKLFFRQCCLCSYKKINEKKITAEDM